MPPGVTTRSAVTDDAADATFCVAATPAANVLVAPAPAGNVAIP